MDTFNCSVPPPVPVEPLLEQVVCYNTANGMSDSSDSIFNDTTHFRNLTFGYKMCHHCQITIPSGPNNNFGDWGDNLGQPTVFGTLLYLLPSDFN